MNFFSSIYKRAKYGRLQSNNIEAPETLDIPVKNSDPHTLFSTGAMRMRLYVRIFFFLQSQSIVVSFLPLE
jgi:hypothetical protein